jgi:hypothetical protein
MVLSLACKSPGQGITILADTAGVARAVRNDFDEQFMMSDTARRWQMLVCLAGLAAESVAASQTNQRWEYPAVNLELTAVDEKTDAGKWDLLAKEELGLDARTPHDDAQLVMRRKRDYVNLCEFFELNRQLLTETALRLSANRGAMCAHELAPFLMKMKCTVAVSAEPLGLRVQGTSTQHPAKLPGTSYTG